MLKLSAQNHDFCQRTVFFLPIFTETIGLNLELFWMHDRFKGFNFNRLVQYLSHWTGLLQLVVITLDVFQ